jgi:NADH-ubiquinone oxidoreductase chain 2
MFLILIAIGFTLYLYAYKPSLSKKLKDVEMVDNLTDVENSPIQLISQLKGYFYINTYLSISLAITLFSFIGIPPLIGFFAKQMVLSAALDEGYIFITLVGIITSVIGAVYYLNIINFVFFEKSNYTLNNVLHSSETFTDKKENDTNVKNHIAINGVLSTLISVLTMLILLFIYVPGE